MNETSVKRQVVNRVWQRYLGWTTISLLTAFLINNFLNIYFGFEGVSRLYISFSGTALISLVIYIAAVVMAVWQVKRTLDESY